ncbi:electron transport complex subunit RsxC [Leptotrichia sp. HSP-334]|uniref:Ion-translocating oxidoreductase complex subunit C n=1 Tax=Leptotrichia rugosa TaxID=3239302 RepID=A0AB39VES2_9FUSO
MEFKEKNFFKKGKIKDNQIEDMKIVTKNMSLKKISESEIFFVPLLQHKGERAFEIVRVGQEVRKYEKIAQGYGSISANIHSPVSGKVIRIMKNFLPDGSKVRTIIIENNFKEERVKLVKRNMRELQMAESEEILKIIEEAGIVGLGGAGFPTASKYDIKLEKIDTFIINGMESEPYLTADYLLMKNYAKEICRGIKVAEKVLRPRHMVIAISEKNKELVSVFERMAREVNIDLQIKILSADYPQGSEILLIDKITGKKIQKGKLTIEKGVIVSNVGTIKAIYDAFFNGKPLIERIVTISGEEVPNAGNYKIRIGTPLVHIVDSLNITKTDKIIFGGPMMGNKVKEPSTPIIKGISGVIFLNEEKIESKNCISCGKCVEVCPMNLIPFEFSKYYEKGRYVKMLNANIFNCIECGACEYVCPSRVPLIESIKNGKEILVELINLEVES